MKFPDFRLRGIANAWTVAVTAAGCAVVLGFAEAYVPGVSLLAMPVLAVFLLRALRRQAERDHLAAVRTLMAAVDAGDRITRGHSRRIEVMCSAVGRRLGMRGRAVDELACAALLHDIGRVAIQRGILEKPGGLDASERTALREHAEIARAWVAGMKFFPGAAEIVRSHHERVDGGGYPQGLAGKRVPKGSRIIMTVAAFDAMTSDRPYRDGLSPEAAFEELLANSGTQFFPDVVDALLALYTGGELFAGFTREELTAYLHGELGSRAVEAWLARSAYRVEAGAPPAGNMLEGLPVIAMPPLEEDVITQEGEFVLSPGRGLKLVVAARSDGGCVRLNNEDAFGMFGEERPRGPALLVVADGLGGHAAGEVASRLAVETVQGAFFGSLSEGAVGETLAEAVSTANASVRLAAEESPDRLGMGTTLTAAAFEDCALTVGHVGDSRAYLVAAEGLVRLTRDHTLAGESLRVVGAEGPSCGAHVLTRCLGGGAQVECDVTEDAVPLGEGDVIVLCTDGLTGVVDDGEIEAAVRMRAPAEACRHLVGLARERGGPDNVTVVVGRVERV